MQSLSWYRPNIDQNAREIQCLGKARTLFISYALILSHDSSSLEQLLLNNNKWNGLEQLPIWQERLIEPRTHNRKVWNLINFMGVDSREREREAYIVRLLPCRQREREWHKIKNLVLWLFFLYPLTACEVSSALPLSRLEEKNSFYTFWNEVAGKRKF